MTQEQKTLILHYREQHMTYRQIGEKLGLSPDTVKTFCRRKRAQSERTEEGVQAQCRNCGAPVHPLPGRRERLFCTRPAAPPIGGSITCWARIPGTAPGAARC